jgi:hypothetical protein
MNQSSDIIINSISAGGLNHIADQKIQFIAPSLSDKLALEYSILVKQYSLSEKEYNFWKGLKQVGEPEGGIFGSQPYPVAGNIHNVNNLNEMVLGYFEVSAVTQKRTFITSEELEPLDLPGYVILCPYLRSSPDDFSPWDPPTWNEIYYSWVDLQHYVFVMPEVVGDEMLPGLVKNYDIVNLVFTTKACALCEESGSFTKPDFWID